MTSRIDKLRALADDPRTPEHEAAAARHAIEAHNEKLLMREPEVEAHGPDLTNRGRPFSARVVGGTVRVAVRQAWADIDDARMWVSARRRMLVRVDRQRYAMIPTDVEVDEERQQVYVTAPSESLTDW